MLDTTFFRACEDAVERWDVQMLALGSLARDETSTLGVGCAVDDRFLVASVTKPMTAALALQVLDLDAPTGVWPDDVRVGHLLAHTSGYTGELEDLHRFGHGDDALAAAVRELPSLERPFGVDEVWSYANGGYWLAGWLAAEAAGTTYEEALQTHVFARAGMTASGFDAPEFPRARRPSGGVVSNVPDLLELGRWLLAEPSLAPMRVVRGKPAGGVYGLGLFGRRVAGVDVWGHPGSYDLYKTALLVVPARSAAFVGLTSGRRGAQALREIEDLWFERLLGERRRRPDEVPLDPEALAAFAGLYSSFDSEATVAVEAGRLVVDFLDRGSGERATLAARSIGPLTFEVVGGDFDGDRFDFPRVGFARFGSRLCRRVG